MMCSYIHSEIYAQMPTSFSPCEHWLGQSSSNARNIQAHRLAFSQPTGKDYAIVHITPHVYITAIDALQNRRCTASKA